MADWKNKLYFGDNLQIIHDYVPAATDMRRVISLLRHVVAAVLPLFVFAATAAGAARPYASLDTGQAICYAVQNSVNTLADFTYTRCWPTLKDGYGFLVVSEKPVLAEPNAKKAWLLIIVAALGNEMNSRNLSGTEMLLSDVSNSKNRVGWSLPVSLAKTLQRRIKNDEITSEEMYAQILSHLRHVSVTDQKR